MANDIFLTSINFDTKCTFFGHYASLIQLREEQVFSFHLSWVEAAAIITNTPDFLSLAFKPIVELAPKGWLKGHTRDKTDLDKDEHRYRHRHMSAPEESVDQFCCNFGIFLTVM